MDKVWVVECHIPHEEGWAEAVFSTERKAKNYIKKAEKKDKYIEYNCIDFEVDE